VSPWRKISRVLPGGLIDMAGRAVARRVERVVEQGPRQRAG
jgi:hypothetical protein